MADSWTKERLKSFIISVLRSGTRRWPSKYETLNEAKTEKRSNKKTGRPAQHYLCAICGEDFPAKEVNVDHVQPVVQPEVGFVDWNTYIDRLFCNKDNLQVACHECHTKKSSLEKKARTKKEVTCKSAKSSPRKKARTRLKGN